MKKIVLFLVAMMMLAVAGSANASIRPYTEQQKIDEVLQVIEKSNVTFIRNGSDHSAHEAAEHLKKKLAYVGDKVQTAKDFINELATASSFTGRPYMVKLDDGREVTSHEWLMARLSEIEQHNTL